MKTPNRVEEIQMFHEEINLLHEQINYELVCHGSIDTECLKHKIQDIVNRAYIQGYRDYEKLNCVNDVDKFVDFEYALVKTTKGL